MIAPASKRANTRLTSGSNTSSAQRGSLVGALMAIADFGLRIADWKNRTQQPTQSAIRNWQSTISCVPLRFHARHHQPELLLGRFGARHFTDNFPRVHHENPIGE